MRVDVVCDDVWNDVYDNVSVCMVYIRHLFSFENQLTKLLKIDKTFTNFP